MYLVSITRLRVRSIYYLPLFMRWTQDNPQPPDLVEVHRRLLAGGHLSRVKYPSPMYLAGKAAPDLAQQAGL
jgi:hypothetical protein